MLIQSFQLLLVFLLQVFLVLLIGLLLDLNSLMHVFTVWRGSVICIIHLANPVGCLWSLQLLPIGVCYSILPFHHFKLLLAEYRCFLLLLLLLLKLLNMYLRNRVTRCEVFPLGVIGVILVWSSLAGCQDILEQSLERVLSLRVVIHIKLLLISIIFYKTASCIIEKVVR